MLLFGMLFLVPGRASAQGPRDEASTGSGVAVGAATEVSAYGDSDHVGVVTPEASISVTSPSTGWSGSGSYLVDVISAASVDIVSTASQNWHEVRHAGNVSVGYKPHDFGVQLAGAISSEPDYLSLTGDGTLTLDFDQKNYTALFGYAYGHDTAGVTGTPFSVFSLKLARHSFNAGLDIPLDRSTLLVLIGDLVIESGDQSKPYRYIPMFAPDVAPTIPNGLNVDRVNTLRLPERPREQLPLNRERASLTARIAHHMEAERSGPAKGCMATAGASRHPRPMRAISSRWGAASCSDRTCGGISSRPCRSGSARTFPTTTRTGNGRCPATAPAIAS